MSGFVGYAIRRRFWRRFHPMVFIGWRVLRQRTAASGTKSAFGLGLIVAGLLLKKSDPVLVHREVIEGSGDVRVRVLPEGAGKGPRA